MRLPQVYSRLLRVKADLDTAVADVDFVNPHGVSVAKQQRLVGLSNNLHTLLDDLRLAFAEDQAALSSTQRVSWQRRIEQVQQDSKLVICTVEKAVGFISRSLEAETERASLLSSAQARRRENRKLQTSEALLAEERARLDTSSMMVDAMISQGKYTVDNLISQKTYLKSAAAKLSSSLLSLGVSSGIVSAAHARLRMDRVIAYGGMLVVSICVYVFYCWWLGYHVFWWFPSNYIMGAWRLCFGKA